MSGPQDLEQKESKGTKSPWFSPPLFPSLTFVKWIGSNRMQLGNLSRGRHGGVRRGREYDARSTRLPAVAGYLRRDSRAMAASRLGMNDQ